jgi:hypothetical protein
MKIKFLQSPNGRKQYSAGDVVEFVGPVEETYARKYIEREWAALADETVAALGPQAALPLVETKPEPKIKASATVLPPGRRGP